MDSERTTKELNDLKTSIHSAREIAQSVYEALSVSEVNDQDLYVELGAWLVEFSTRIGDLMVLKMVIEVSGANDRTDQGTLMVLAAMVPMKESYEQLLDRTQKMLDGQYGNILRKMKSD